MIDPDKRLFTQSERIKHRPEWIQVVMIEGDVFGRRQRMSVQQITGAITFLSMIQRMSVITTLDIIHSSYMIIKLGAHGGENGLGYEVALRSNKPKAILSARRFVAATERDLLEVPGIGPQRAKQIREVLTG